MGQEYSLELPESTIRTLTMYRTSRARGTTASTTSNMFGHDTEAERANGTATIKELETDKQRSVLDVIARIKKYGLDGHIELPQIVVCGDQSSGKSSVLEALTEIPFPRDEQLCTRFATEISLRHEATESFAMKLIPDPRRPEPAQERMSAWSTSVKDLGKLPKAMKEATRVMGLSEIDGGKEDGNAFTRDILRVEIAGPTRPHLDLVDIPGHIQSATKGITDDDVRMVNSITEDYISRGRAICLAVVQAANDAANQAILNLVRRVDPEGERTIGVITKPDHLVEGSRNEKAIIQLARNEDIVFKLGWHVLKNRACNQMAFSFDERNTAEATFFQSSRFNQIPSECVGIGKLRPRLARLLFKHIKTHLPRLVMDMDTLLVKNSRELDLLGNPRSTLAECKRFMISFAVTCTEICKSGLQGHYANAFFKDTDENAADQTTETAKLPITRIRAGIQLVNYGFSEDLRKRGHKYSFGNIVEGGDVNNETVLEAERLKESLEACRNPRVDRYVVTELSPEEAMAWVQKKIHWSRGRELVGSHNPMVVAELFEELSKNWEPMAQDHIKDVMNIVKRFFKAMIRKSAPSDLGERVWNEMVAPWLLKQDKAARDQLTRLLEDRADAPINYDNSYTTNVQDLRLQRFANQLLKNMPEHSKVGYSVYSQYDVKGNVQKAMTGSCAGMEAFSCDEAINSLNAIYSVQRKVFVANVTTQIVEREILRNLHYAISPDAVADMDDQQIMAIAAENKTTAHQREILIAQVKSLEECKGLLEDILQPGM